MRWEAVSVMALFLLVVTLASAQELGVWVRPLARNITVNQISGGGGLDEGDLPTYLMHLNGSQSLTGTKTYQKSAFGDFGVYYDTTYSQTLFKDTNYGGLLGYRQAIADYCMATPGPSFDQRLCIYKSSGSVFGAAYDGAMAFAATKHIDFASGPNIMIYNLSGLYIPRQSNLSIGGMNIGRWENVNHTREQGIGYNSFKWNETDSKRSIDTNYNNTLNTTIGVYGNILFTISGIEEDKTSVFCDAYVQVNSTVVQNMQQDQLGFVLIDESMAQTKAFSFYVQPNQVWSINSGSLEFCSASIENINEVALI